VPLWCANPRLCLCREVHVWCVDPAFVLGRADLMAEYEGMVSEEEREQLGSAESEEVRGQRLLTRALARVTIARCQCPTSYLEKHHSPSVICTRALIFSGDCFSTLPFPNEDMLKGLSLGGLICLDLGFCFVIHPLCQWRMCSARLPSAPCPLWVVPGPCGRQTVEEKCTPAALSSSETRGGSPR